MSRAGLDLIEGRRCCSVMKAQFGCKIEVYLSKRCCPRVSEKVANKTCVNTKTPLFYSAADGWKQRITSNLIIDKLLHS